MVVGWFNTVGISYDSDDIADYLVENARPKVTGTHPNNEWGRGFLELPCPSQFISAPPRQRTITLDSSDCQLDRWSTKPDRYVEYYTFKLSEKTKLKIGSAALISGGRYTAPSVFLLEGLNTGITTTLNRSDGTTTTPASFTTGVLEPGAYT